MYGNSRRLLPACGVTSCNSSIALSEINDRRLPSIYITRPPHLLALSTILMQYLMYYRRRLPVLGGFGHFLQYVLILVLRVKPE